MLCCRGERISPAWSSFFAHLFGNTVPLLVANAHVHTLLVEELALLWNQKDVAHKFTHCKHKRRHANCQCRAQILNILQPLVGDGGWGGVGWGGGK